VNFTLRVTLSGSSAALVSRLVAPFISMTHQLDGGRYAGSPQYVFTGYGIAAGMLLVCAFVCSRAAGLRSLRPGRGPGVARLLGLTIP
jgi:hypothetical protein